jgi:hypothetical protein
MPRFARHNRSLTISSINSFYGTASYTLNWGEEEESDYQLRRERHILQMVEAFIPHRNHKQLRVRKFASPIADVGLQVTECAVPHAIAMEIFTELSGLNIPVIALDLVVGMDGISYELNYKAGLHSSRFNWWEDVPKVWKPLMQFHSKTSAAFDEMLDSGKIPMSKEPAYINDEDALVTASYHGAHELVRSLVEGGADINITNDYGDTAIMVAIEYRHHAIFEYLLDRGANINIINEDGNTALDMAKYYDSDAVELLVARGGTGP